jgi:hypothetical protein
VSLPGLLIDDGDLTDPYIGTTRVQARSIAAIAAEAKVVNANVNANNDDSPASTSGAIIVHHHHPFIHRSRPPGTSDVDDILYI